VTSDIFGLNNVQAVIVLVVVVAVIKIIISKKEDVTVVWNEGVHTNREVRQIGQI
jgi:hypothetical protein